MALTLPQLTDHLRNLRGVQHKLDIQAVREFIGGQTADAVLLGDDCAAISDPTGGYLLFAIEGLLDEFVAAEPWFAGYCAVMVNVSDVYAMGGRPLAIVDALWTAGAERSRPIWEGMTAAAQRYAVPIVGGHTNSRSAGDHLAAAILGRADSLLSSFDARPGDVLISAVDLRGEWFGPYAYWNASTMSDPLRLRLDLEILPELAEEGLCAAAKDVSMGGLVGTAAMLAECSGVGVTIDVSAVPAPQGVALDKWLSCFPSYGFLLATDPARAATVCERFRRREIAAAVVGSFDDSRLVRLADASGAREPFWDLGAQAFIGLGCGVAS